MYTFKDLEFKAHDVVPGGIHAVMNFDNGYGISVVQGYGLYGDISDNTYEVAFLYHNQIMEPTEYTIHGYVSVDEIDVMMEDLQTATIDTDVTRPY